MTFQDFTEVQKNEVVWFSNISVLGFFTPYKPTWVSKHFYFGRFRDGFQLMNKEINKETNKQTRRTQREYY